MNGVVGPLAPDDSGQQVADLQTALQTLVERQVIAIPDAERDELERVLRDETSRQVFGAATQSLVDRFRLAMRLGGGVGLDADTAAALNRVLAGDAGPGDDRCVVRGRVIGAGPGYVVRAYDRDMRSEEFLGDAAIEGGQYEIAYSSAHFARAEKGSADVRVALLNDAGREVASTPIIFNAAPVQVAPDLVLPDDGRSEYERLIDECTPLVQDVPFEDLTEDDVAFLTGETGIDAELIQLVAEAARRARETAADRERGIEPVPPEAFYGLFRNDVPTVREALLRTPLDTLGRALKAAIRENVVPAALRDRFRGVMASLRALQADLTLAPAEKGEAPSLGDLLSALPEALPPDQLSALALAVGPDGVASLRQDHLDALVESQALTSGQAEQVALAAVAFHLADGDPAVTRGVLAVTEPDTHGPRLRTVADLAGLDAGDWRAVVADAGVEPPEGLTVDGFAEELTDRVALVLPTDFLTRRVTAVPADLAELVKDGDGSTPPEPVVQLIRRNPGLGLDDVLGGPDDAEAKAHEIERLVGLVAETRSRNPRTNLLELDHSPDSPDLEALRLPDVDDADRAKILKNLRAHQRAFLAGKNARTALTLLDGGFDASRKIVALNPGAFAAASGLPAGEAVAVHYAATKATNAATMKSIALYQRTKSHAPPAALPAESPADYLAKIPGYSTLFPDDFGFCDCEECGSVLGLPAYFVDLMFFVETHILRFLPAPAALPIHLHNRRPDLWNEIDLNCKGANEVVAYLEIVNEILAKHVAAHLGLAQGAAVWEPIAKKNPSFALPFHLPLTRVETYLSHFGKRRFDAAVACGADEAVRARARLGLSEVEAAMIVKPAAVNFTALTAAELAFLTQLYGDLKINPNGQLDPQVVVSAILDPTGASREVLGELVATGFVGGAAPPTFRSGRGTPASLQNDTEVIESLTAAHLDRLHRLYRLSRHVPWTIPELDRTLGRLTAEHVCSGLDDDAPLRIARLLDLQERLGLGVEELCGMWTALPNDSLGGQPGLFDSLFNPPQLESLGNRIQYVTITTAKFQHPSFNATGTSVPQDDNTLARLLAGLRVSDQELVELLGKLAVPLALGAGNELTLSIGNLTLLYRHATLARCLGLTVAGLFQLFELAGLPQQSVRDWSLSAAVPPTLVDDLGTVLAAHGWTSGSTLTADEIAFVTGHTVVDRAKLVAAEKRADAAVVVDAVVTQLLADRAFEFADTVLSGLPNGTDRTLSEDESRTIVQANGPLFETPPGRTTLRLTQAVSAADVTIPAADTPFAVTAAQVAAELTKHSVFTLLPPALAKTLGFSLEKTTSLLRLRGQTAVLATDQFRNGFMALIYEQSAIRTALADLVKALVPYAVLYRDELYDQPRLDKIYDDRASFHLALGPIPVEALRLTTLFGRLAAGPDPGYATSAPKADVAAVLDVVDSGVAAPASDALARALRTDKAALDALLPHLTAVLPANALDALAMMAACLELTSLLGVSGETLSDLALPSAAGTEYERLRRAADALFAGFRTKYGTEAEFRQKVEPYEDILRSRMRDGLVAFICFTEPLKFPLENDLYDYFLVDVATEGCARTTRIAAAIFSLQLYVHRVLMHLERTQHIDVGEVAQIPLAEWDWRRHFRTWQANRRVFLYPENYLTPGLRDDKTPLFEDLEDTLLQQQVTEQNVRDAYARYLTGFDELAGLQLVAACWQQGDPSSKPRTPDVLHLFGVTTTEPPVFYYRAIAGLGSATKTQSVQFAPWRKVDLQIAAKSCSAVIYRGTLYVFWAEITTRPKTSFDKGSSTFVGYKHRLAVKFSSLRLDGRWNAPQRLRFFHLDGGETLAVDVDDPLEPLDPSPFAVGHADVLTTIGDGPTPQKPLKAHLDPLKRPQTEPLDDYALTDPVYSTPYATAAGSSLTVYAGDSLWTVDVFHRTATFQRRTFGAPVLALSLFVDSSKQPIGIGDFTASTVLTDYAASGIRLEAGVKATPTAPILAPVTSPQRFVAIPVNGDTEAAVVTAGQDAFYVRLRSGHFSTTRLGSTIADRTAETLVSSSRGLETVLGISYQAPLEEVGLPLTLSPAGSGSRAQQIGFTGAAKTVTSAGGGVRDSYPIDFQGAVGDYYREIWCHIPWAIADSLHGQGRYSDAKRWYEVVFDPAAQNQPPASDAKRVWQYRELREETVETLRTALSSAAELAVYEDDPFSPHAIARLRPGAYAKAMVMQYIDNLIDWGDSLFTQFTAESINEATMLYVLALDILGPRARDAGPCGEEKLDAHGNPVKKNYDVVAPLLRAGYEFAIEVENLWVVDLVPLIAEIEFAQAVAAVRSSSQAVTADFAESGTGPTQPFGWQQARPAFWSTSGGTPLSDLQLGMTLDGDGGPVLAAVPDGRSIFVEGDPKDPPVTGPPGLPGGLERGGRIGHAFDTQQGLTVNGRDHPVRHDGPTVHTKPWQLLDASIAFCIPDNQDLRAYWDRVEGRLFNIRNCRDITGTARVPDLFGPPIDPRLLIKAKAAGLTLDDVLNVTSGNVPPHRFTYLLEKARQYASTVQSFGGALLSALEKRDGETLANLRTAHEQHLLTLRRRVQEFEVAAAEQARDGLLLQQQTAEYRRDYYRALSQTGLNAWERTEQVSRHLVSTLHEVEAVVQLVRAALSLLPQLGAPTAMKYGGMETSGAASGFASASQALAQAAEAASSSAGLEATFQRRDDDWKQQAALAQREVDQLKKQVAAAELRIQIAERSLEVHDETLTQTEELYQFSRNRFTSLGLYTLLSTTLQRLYRESFNAAFSMALLAEQAYRFERPADKRTLLQRDHWDASLGGLLAGERLLLDLEGLERKYLETDYRQLEIEQSFSLAQWNPAALAKLREVGTCTFDVDELFFDLAYPGHYRRRTKAVRLTLPCVVGPYANASATLKLVKSELRLEPTAAPTQVPPRHSISIAASSGQNDGGVFEFNFRDERYMPFEGSGAVSTWQLSLPKAFRPFDYGTISDVVLRINYTAEQDETLRQNMDAALSQTATSVWQVLKTEGLPLLLSLRRDLPDVWRNLVTAPAGTDVEVTIDERYLPSILVGWLGGRALQDTAKKPQVSLTTTAILLEAPGTPTPAVGTAFGLTAREASTAAPGTSLDFVARGADGLFSAPFQTTVTVPTPTASTDVKLVLRVAAAGPYAPPQPPPGAPAPTVTVDEAKLRNVMIKATLKISTNPA